MRFDPDTGELDHAHLASLIDRRTKLVRVRARRISSQPEPAVVGPGSPEQWIRQPEGRVGRISRWMELSFVPSTR